MRTGCGSGEGEARAEKSGESRTWQLTDSGLPVTVTCYVGPRDRGPLQNTEWCKPEIVSVSTSQAVACEVVWAVQF